MNAPSSPLSALVAQFPVTLDLRANLDSILAALDGAQPDDLVILPEGALSGYDEDPAFLRDLDQARRDVVPVG